MKKQINPTTKAHLIRGAFYLLLLLAVCAIPFALAQSRSRGAAKRTTAEQIAAANGQRTAPLSTGAVPGTFPEKPASRSSTSSDRSQLLPYDVRGLPDLPRMSQFPQATSGTGAAHVLPILRPPKTPQVVLYDQYNNASTTATLSATFTDFPTFNADLADDFIVPGGQTWNVQSIDADGLYFNGAGPATDWNVFIYANSGVLPGTQVYSTLHQPVTVSGTTFTVNLSPAAVLPAGTYWIEIQANMTFGTQGEWGWTDRTVLSNSPAAWQNPGGGFACGPTWVPKLTCVPTAGGPDQVYRINGTIGGGGTPSPTPTATPTPTGSPAGCTTYVTVPGTGTITAGTTDTGNHCDDCVTAITFPFPVSVYGQTFNSANVASNGSLDLIGTQAPFTHGCQVLPNTLWTMAILPYQDDLRTDNLSWAGCNVFPGATCGVFTSVTGTAPNRQFNIEWRAVHFADTTTSVNFEVVFSENSQTHFDVIYGATSDNGLDETSGVQASATGPATTFSCGVATLTNGLKVTYNCAGGGGSPTPTATATATGSPSGCIINGSIDTSDPTQVDRLFRSGIPQTCPASTSCATFGDPTPRHYDSYTFTNTTGSTQCVTVDTTTACTGTNFIFIAAYLGSFDPNNICTNWIGDSGFSPNPEQAFQFNVDNGQTFVVVVSEVTPNAGCPAYTLTITPQSICGGGVSPTPTATATATGGTPTPSPTCTPSGSKIYNIAGFTLGGQTTTTRIYDITTNSWTVGAPIPEPAGLSDHATAYWNGKIYVAGGYNGTGAINTLRIYDIATNSWTTGAPLPQALYLPGFGAINGKVYIASGNNGSTEINTLYIYDIAANSWTTGPVVPTPVTGPGSAVYQGKLYLFGGAAPFPTTITTTQIYDPVANSWSSGPSMNVARLWFYGGAIDNTSIVAPGGDGTPGIPINDNEQLTGTWAIKAPMPYAARGPFAVSDGTFVYIGGGYDGSSVHTDTLRYDPVANSYTPLAPAPDSHYLSQAVLVPGGGCGTPTPTPTATPTATHTPTATPTATATATHTPTATPTATATATHTPTATPTATATATSTATATATATATPTSTIPPRISPTPRSYPTPPPRP